MRQPPSRFVRAIPTLPLALLLLACQPSGEAATPPERITSDSGQELTPSLSPDGSALVFSKLTAPGNSDIYVVRDGGAPTNLTADHPLGDGEPAFSPDGQQIAFRSVREGGGIFVMPAAGGTARRLIDEGFNPAWTPDGATIVYGTNSVAQSPYGAANNSVLWAVDVASGEKRQISPGYGIGPEVSPNGQRVAYWALGASGAERDIWTVGVDGTDAVQVTNDAAVDWSPAWAPDGEHLYFASDRDGAMKIWRVEIDQTSGEASDEPELVSQDGGAQIRGHLRFNAQGELTYIDATIDRTLFAVGLDAAGALQGTAIQIQDPTLSPSVDIASSSNGSMVAWRSGDNRQEDIYVVNADGSGRRQLTNDAFRDRAPTWSPDDSRIAFRSTRPSNRADSTPSDYYQLWIMNADGSRVRQLTNSPDASASAGTWSPDGSTIAFNVTSRTGGTVWYLMNSDGSATRVLFESPTVVDGFVFSPDSRRVAYHPTGGATAFVLDVTRTNPTPEALPAKSFAPLSWSRDGGTIVGSEIRPGQPNRPVAYHVNSRIFEDLGDVGAGAAWLSTTKILVNRDGGTRLQVIDDAMKSVTDLLSVTAPSTLAYDFADDGRRLFYIQSDFEADIYRMTVR